MGTGRRLRRVRRGGAGDPAGGVRRAAARPGSGGQEFQHVVDEERRPDQGLEDPQEDGPEPVRVLDVVHQGTDQAQAVDGVSTAGTTVAPRFPVSVRHALTVDSAGKHRRTT